MKKFFKEFKAFISKGNVFDMAVGLIIATAFNKIVSSLVNDIIMPLVTWATGAASLKELSLPLRETYNEATGLYEVTLSWAYGNFLQTIIDFLIIGFSVFLMVKVMNSSRAKFKELAEFAVEQTKKEVKQERKRLRKLAKEQGRPFIEVWKENEAEKERLAQEAKAKKEAEEKQKAEEYAKEHPSTEVLLKDIRDLLAAKVQQEDSEVTDKVEA